jgi:site-specific DNA-methyltransferase (adenine-specific)
MRITLNDCLTELKTMEENSVDSIVTDPPYGLAFMGKQWDYDVPSVEIWKECLRVLKPGGHLLSFASSRTYHRMAINIEDAGFEIRDQIMWVYGSGFPKSLDISKKIDKKAGAKRKVIGYSKGVGVDDDQGYGGIARGGVGIVQKPIDIPITAPATEDAQKWNGWGTNLKPAHEPIVMARKPIELDTIADNVVKYGTGAINIDASRISYNGEIPNIGGRAKHGRGDGYGFKPLEDKIEANVNGRWPANIMFECICDNPKIVDDKYDIRAYNNYKNTFQSYEENDSVKGEYKITDVETKAIIHTNPNCPCYMLDEQSGSDKIGASRFFYCPKANKKERGDGNIHPTVKPIALMEYLIKLITPEKGIVLDPFMGSGTTGIAAVGNDFDFIGIEREKEYYKIAKARIKSESLKRKFF